MGRVKFDLNEWQHFYTIDDNTLVSEKYGHKIKDGVAMLAVALFRVVINERMQMFRCGGLIRQATADFG